MHISNPLNHYGRGGWRPGAAATRKKFYRHMQSSEPTSSDSQRDFLLLTEIRGMKDRDEQRHALERAIAQSVEHDGEQSGILVDARKEFYLLP